MFQLDPLYKGDPLRAPVEARRFLALHSRSLTKSERHHSATKRELLAIVDTFRAWRPHLWGERFTLLTDHKALTYVLSQTSVNSMLERWMDTVVDLDYEVINNMLMVSASGTAVTVG